MRHALMLTVLSVLPALNAAESFTVHIWAGFPSKIDRSGEYTLMFKGHRDLDDPKAQYVLSLRYGYPEFKYFDAQGNWCGIMMFGWNTLSSSSGSIPTKACPSVRGNQPWHHLAGVYNRGTVSLYFDGRLVLRSFNNPEPPENDLPLRIGSGEGPSGHTDFRFPGETVEPTYLPRALGDDEIAALHADGAKRLAERTPASNPLVYPEPPVKGELKATADYFARLATKPPRGTNCVAKIVKVNGIPRISVNDEIVPGMAMLPSPHVDNAAVEFACRDFAAHGVRFFSNIWWSGEPQNKWWLGEGKYDFGWFDRRMEALIRASPEGWVFPRIKMDPPSWWKQAHPDEFYCHQVRPESEKWRVLRTRMLRDVVAHVEQASYAAHVIGYHIGALYGSEWAIVAPPQKDFPKSDAARLAFLDAQSKAVADALLDAAHVVKEASHGNKLVGSFFGYSNNWLHRDFQRVVRSDDLDFFCAPDQYHLRRGGAAGRSQVAALASCRLHGKVFWIEADERTPYAKSPWSYRCETLDEAVQVAKRTIGYTLTEGWETWWFLLEGNDSFHDETLLDVIAHGQDVATKTLRTAPPRTEADVAVFRRIQELDYGPFSPKNLDDLYDSRLYAHRLPAAGVAYDTYVFEDIMSPDLPDYKVYVFPDAKTLTPTEREAVRRLVERKGKTMMCFCAETEGEFALPNGGRRVDFRRPPKADVLQRVFSEAGAHIWIDTPGIIAAGRGFLMVHAAKGGVKTVRLPFACDVSEIYGLAPTRKGVRTFDENLAFGQTRIYRLTPAADEGVQSAGQSIKSR